MARWDQLHQYWTTNSVLGVDVNMGGWGESGCGWGGVRVRVGGVRVGVGEVSVRVGGVRGVGWVSEP